MSSCPSGMRPCQWDYNARMDLLRFFAVVSSGLFAGAAIYVTVVEHPARLNAGISVALQQFRPSYRRAAIFQAGLAVLCCVCGILVWWFTGHWSWLAGCGLVGISIPYTLLFVMPVNRLLLDTVSPPAGAVALELMAKWGRLHLFRTVTGVLGFATLVAQCLRSD
jgi:hypothetical protein